MTNRERCSGFMDTVAVLGRAQAVIAQVDIAAIGEPAFRLVATGTGPILVTDGGIDTAPLTALAP